MANASELKRPGKRGNPRDQSVPPHHADGAQSVAYGDWLLKFCVSVSWRVILEFREKDSLSDYTDEQLIRIDAASRAWADFLLGRISHPGMFEQHFLLMDAIEEAPSDMLPANINRYILCFVDSDVVRGSGTLFTYAKLGKFLILGFMQLARPKEWSDKSTM